MLEVKFLIFNLIGFKDVMADFRELLGVRHAIHPTPGFRSLREQRDIIRARDDLFTLEHRLPSNNNLRGRR